jgi:hypothetical protein
VGGWLAGWLCFPPFTCLEKQPLDVRFESRDEIEVSSYKDTYALTQ